MIPRGPLILLLVVVALCGAARTWAACRARFPGDRPTAGGASLQGPSWSFVPHPGGLGLQITW